jgi:membrane carboxypeptidase/penicillin-binding protein PbpC
MRHVSGIAGAAPIWHDFMEEVHRGKPVVGFEEPPGLVRREICADSGLLPLAMASEATHPTGAAAPTRCSRTITELFIEGTEPKEYDNWHFQVRLDRRNGLLASPVCPQEYVVQRDYTLYPPEAGEWVRNEGVPLPPTAYSPLCPPEDGLVALHSLATAPSEGPRSPDGSRPQGNCLILSSPDQGAIYRRVKSIPLEHQKIKVALYAACDAPVKTVTVLVDGQPFAHLAAPPFEAFWTLSPGSHSFSAIALDGSGNELNSNDVSIAVY